MSLITEQLLILQSIHTNSFCTKLGSGAHLISIVDVELPSGWNRSVSTLHFIAPPGYPGAQPDCFWVEPSGIRLTDGSTPLNTNDTNPIPEVGPKGTWFSWHLQRWDPNSDSLVTYFKVMMDRLKKLQ